MEIKFEVYRKKVALEMGALKEQLIMSEVAREELETKNRHLEKLVAVKNRAIAELKPEPDGSDNGDNSVVEES